MAFCAVFLSACAFLAFPGGSVPASAAECEHNWVSDGGQNVDTKQPTCTEPYEEHWTCSICGASDYEHIDALGHDWRTATYGPTCVRGTLIRKTCTRCGEVEETITGSPDPNKHAWEAVEVHEPTCTTAGYTIYECSLCGDGNQVGGLPATGHTWIQGDTLAAAATCTHGAYYWNKCSVCDVSAATLLDPTPGIELDWSGIDPDLYTEVGSPAAHTWQQVATPEHHSIAATCWTGPQYNYTCSACGAESENSFVSGDPLGHNFYNGVCTRCHLIDVTGVWYLNDTIVINSSFDVNVSVLGTGSTLSKDCALSIFSSYIRETSRGAFVYSTTGGWTYTAYRAIHVKDFSTLQTESQYRAAVQFFETNASRTCPHLYEVKEEHAATCTTAGYTVYECTLCGDGDQVGGLPATGHTWIESDVLARAQTCTEGAYYWKKCSVCGVSATTMLDSTPGVVIDWSDVDSALYTVVGEGKGHHFSMGSCTDCGLRCSHSWVIDDSESQAPTCTDPGVRGMVCSICGQNSSSTIPATGHNFVNGVCTVCGASELFTVTFYDWDFSVIATKQCEQGETVSLPADPERRGYDFVTWKFYEEGFLQGDFVKFEDVTRIYWDTYVYAVYEPVYIVVHITDGVTGEASDVEILRDYTLAESYDPPTHIGYTFTGYTRDGSDAAFDADQKITASVSLTAVYEQNFVGAIIEFFKSLGPVLVVLIIVGLVVLIYVFDKNKKSSRRRRR